MKPQSVSSNTPHAAVGHASHGQSGPDAVRHCPRIMHGCFAVILMLAAALLCGCATETVHPQPPAVAAPPALTLAQVKEMTSRGVSDETILGALRASGGVYHLTNNDLLELQEAKVSPAVMDYLLSTRQHPPPPPSPPPVRYRYYYYPPVPYPYFNWYFDFHHGHHGHHGYH